MSEETNNQLGQDTPQQNETETKQDPEQSQDELNKVVAGVASVNTQREAGWEILGAGAGDGSPQPPPIVQAFLDGFHKGQKA
jgi:hypothetical protein